MKLFFIVLQKNVKTKKNNEKLDSSNFHTLYPKNRKKNLK